MEIKKLLVIGTGQMGTGIAQVAAVAGKVVLLNDISESHANKGIANIQKSLTRAVEKSRLSSEEAQEALARISPSSALTDVVDCDMCIEASSENMSVKVQTFRQLDSVAQDHIILATNTSSLSITELAASTKRPERIIGMHFMLPVPAMKLVEIIRGLATSDEVYETVAGLADEMGKTAVSVNDFPGFVANRVLMTMINEAIYCVYEGVADPQAIDQVMRYGMNHPMGPLALADFIGLDTCLSVMEVLYDGFGDSKYRPCPLLRKYVKAGWLGRKTGRGFYNYA